LNSVSHRKKMGLTRTLDWGRRPL